MCSLRNETKESWQTIKERYSIQMLERGLENTKDNRVNKSLMLSYDSLEKKHESAAFLCSLTGVFQHSTIFVDRLKQLYSESKFDAFERDLAILVRFGLVTIQDTAGIRVLSIHSLLHEAIQLLARDTLPDYYQYELLLMEKIASTPCDVLKS